MFGRRNQEQDQPTVPWRRGDQPTTRIPRGGYAKRGAPDQPTEGILRLPRGSTAARNALAARDKAQRDLNEALRRGLSRGQISRLKRELATAEQNYRAKFGQAAGNMRRR